MSKEPRIELINTRIKLAWFLCSALFAILSKTLGEKDDAGDFVMKNGELRTFLAAASAFFSFTLMAWMLIVDRIAKKEKPSKDLLFVAMAICLFSANSGREMEIPPITVFSFIVMSLLAIVIWNPGGQLKELSVYFRRLTLGLSLITWMSGSGLLLHFLFLYLAKDEVAGQTRPIMDNVLFFPTTIGAFMALVLGAMTDKHALPWDEDFLAARWCISKRTLIFISLFVVATLASALFMPHGWLMEESIKASLFGWSVSIYSMLLCLSYTLLVALPVIGWFYWNGIRGGYAAIIDKKWWLLLIFSAGGALQATCICLIKDRLDIAVNARYVFTIEISSAYFVGTGLIGMLTFFKAIHDRRNVYLRLVEGTQPPA